MGALGRALGFDAWAAHSAGLFEECGKALLFRNSPSCYRRLWAGASTNDCELSTLELDAFGTSHDILGAALCETWGLTPSAVHSVRHHVEFQASLVLPRPESYRAICGLSALAHRVMCLPADTTRCIELVAKQLGLPPERVAAVVPIGPHRLGVAS